MYMDSINYKKDFVFMTDKGGNLTGGGFKIQSDLLKDGMPLEIELADGFYWVFDFDNELAFCSSSNNILTVIRRLC